MKVTIIVATLLLINFANLTQASCEDFVSEKAGAMNLGTSVRPACATVKEESEFNLRLSLSKEKGRSDKGPTVSLTRETNSVRINQLFSKDPLTKHRHRYLYFFDSECKTMSSLSYTAGGLMTQVNAIKCANLTEEFTAEEVALLQVQKLCDEYFVPLVDETTEDSTVTTIKRE